MRRAARGVGGNAASLAAVGDTEMVRSPTLALLLLVAACARERGVAVPSEAIGPEASHPGVPSLEIASSAQRDALVAAGEPTLREVKRRDGVETTLVLQVGHEAITLARAVWDRDRCEDFSHHYAVVDATHGLVDARINCHFGEDFWTTEVIVELVTLDLATATATALWSGSETYTGAMGECTTADGAIEYAIDGDTVWQTRTSWASWEPQDPREPLVPRFECVRPASADTRTAIAKLRPPR